MDAIFCNYDTSMFTFEPQDECLRSDPQIVQEPGFPLYSGPNAGGFAVTGLPEQLLADTVYTVDMELTIQGTADQQASPALCLW